MSNDERVDEFESFFAAETAPLLRIAVLLTGSPDEAQDIVQEVLVRAWLHWDKVRLHDNPSAWARRTLRNLTFNWFRHRRVVRRHETTSVPAPVSSSEPDHHDLLVALGQLAPRPREALVLHDVVGLSVAEIATEMNVPEGTVRSWLHRGRQKVASSLRTPTGTTTATPAAAERR